jgi:hypothetical protein
MIAVGFRVKSGFAIAVTVEGPASAPSAVSRRVIEMSDSAVPETRQPYHDGLFRTEEDAGEIARRVKIVKRCAAKSIAALLKDTGATRAGLIVGSLIEPEKVGNPHIRAHASEGQLFRTVLVEALLLGYHGLALEATKRFTSNLHFKAAYTWSHLMDDSTAAVPQ